MRHGIVTIVTPIRAGRENDVRDRLRDLGDDVLPREHLIGLHFASLSVIGAPPDFTPHVVFEASFDGTREDFIDDLVATAGPTLDSIYQDCTGYPQPGTQLPQVVKNYLLRHDVGADCLFIAYPNRTVGQIKHEHQLRRTLAALDRYDRDTLAPWHLPPPTQRSLASLLRRQIAATPALQGTLTLPERPFLVTYGPQIADTVFRTVGALLFLGLVVSVYSRWGGLSELKLSSILVSLGFAARLIAVWRPNWGKTSLTLFVAAAAVWVTRIDGADSVIYWVTRGLVAVARYVMWIIGIVIAVVAAWVLIVQLHEWSDPEPPLPSWDPRREEMLRRLEQRDAQNHMVGLNRIKPGFLNFRLWNVRFVLWTIHITKHLGKSGLLSGISSIHFARWVVIDHGRQVLFLTNYDGDWDAYLGDFVEQASKGLTAIWSNCVGFPRAWLLLGGGARDQRAFKAYARGSQHETLWVYRAYPQLTVANIENHTAIRAALGESLDAAGLEALLRRL